MKSKKREKQLQKISSGLDKNMAAFIKRENPKHMIPQEIMIRNEDSGFFFGLPSDSSRTHYIGMQQGDEGNILVIGGNGSGKSAGIAKPTLRTWQGPIIATDIKGELANDYQNSYLSGHSDRPFVVFDPLDLEGPAYDPFGWLLEDEEENLIGNIWEIVLAIIPIRPDDSQPFWPETERGILAAALLYFFDLGLSFSEAMSKIVATTVTELCAEMKQSNDIRVEMFLGELAEMKPETMANIDRGLRNRLMLFATDPYISHVFRGIREGARCFNWADLDEKNIFLRIPAHKIEQWGPAIMLMLTQLIRCLERRPEPYCVGGCNPETLLILDEFARLGKLELITAAVTTLRSKSVNFCIMVQSIAQLDAIYGEKERRIIADNCQYKVVLRADDAETQMYLCELIGTSLCPSHSISKNMDMKAEVYGYGMQLSERREWKIHPHELSALHDKALLLTPYGFCSIIKHLVDNTPETQFQISIEKALALYLHKENEGARMLKVEERIKNVEAKIKKNQTAKRQAREAQKRIDQRRNYVIGEIVVESFPELRRIEPGTQDENDIRFRHFKVILKELASDPEFIAKLKKKAEQSV